MSNDVSANCRAAGSSYLGTGCMIAGGVFVVLLLPPLISSAIRFPPVPSPYREINILCLTLDAFKQSYGIYPPSRIRLRENSTYCLNDEFDRHSYAYLKRIWPQMRIATSPTRSEPLPATVKPFVWYAEYSPDGGDGKSQTYELEGDECLVFFLAGIAQNLSPANSASGPFRHHGFSKSPYDPSGLPDVAIPQSLARSDRFYDFEPSRIFIRDNSLYPGSVAPGMPSDMDFASAANPRPPKLPSYRPWFPDSSNPRPYAYFSSYEGRGYRPNDMNIDYASDANADSRETASPGEFWVAGRGFQMAYPSPSPNPYTESVPNPSSSINWDGTQRTPEYVPARYYNPASFQLFITGSDNLFGPGGQLPLSPNTLASHGFGDSGSIDASYDNYANFSKGHRLGEFKNEPPPRAVKKRLLSRVFDSFFKS